MAQLQGLAYLLTGLFFIFFGIFDSIYWSHTLTMIRQHRIPYASIILIIAIIWETIAGIMIIIGLYPRYAALSLIPFTLAYIYLFYPFWKFKAHERRVNMVLFITNITVTLAVLFFIASIP